VAKRVFSWEKAAPRSVALYTKMLKQVAEKAALPEGYGL
jgi:hypothetical protein